MAKFVFVTGGVVSGLGKGITASSLALLLKARGYKVFMQKFDPYINVDPGTMSPLQHGEVFVTADGTETDLDLGHYERFIDEELNFTSNITTGKIYSNVIAKERRGEYLGSTVQMVPHVTNEIKDKIYAAANTSNADIVITEIGGTIGDIESQIFVEALRQVRNELGKENTLFVHATLIPSMYSSGELKTKPTQHSVIELRSLGIQPDLIVCRSSIELDDAIKEKISLFCNVPKENVIESLDVKNIYQIPLNYFNQNMDNIVLKQFNLKITKANIKYWENLVTRVDNLKDEIEIALIGKYTQLHDAYISVVESLKHAGYSNDTKITIKWINAEDLESKKDISSFFKNSNGIIVPSGFGSRGTKGMIKAIEYARVNNIPFLGICLGMQLALIELATNVCNIEKASSTEFDELCLNPVIDIMSDQKRSDNINSTLRLGNYECKLKKGSLTAKYYDKSSIFERHRHRYEFNNRYLDIMQENGIVFSGINEQTNLVEIIEYPKHPYFIACQFHPEFKSRPYKPHPLFKKFIEESHKLYKKRTN